MLPIFPHTQPPSGLPLNTTSTVVTIFPGASASLPAKSFRAPYQRFNPLPPPAAGLPCRFIGSEDRKPVPREVGAGPSQNPVHSSHSLPASDLGIQISCCPSVSPPVFADCRHHHHSPRNSARHPKNTPTTPRRDARHKNISDPSARPRRTVARLPTTAHNYARGRTTSHFHPIISHGSMSGIAASRCHYEETDTPHPSIPTATPAPVAPPAGTVLAAVYPAQASSVTRIREPKLIQH